MIGKKLAIIWLITTSIVTIFGYILLWHGGVYLEAAQRQGQTGYIYQFEVVVGNILLWPSSIIGWAEYLFSKQKGAMGLPMLLLLQVSGYYFVFYVYSKFKGKYW